LETTHDCIQWLFPTMQPPRLVANAPVLTSAYLREAAKQGGKPRRQVVRALDRTLMFYGPGVQLCVAKGGSLNPSRKWTGPSDHNAHRLTRIIMSLRLCVISVRS
ncbi:unnamed protein product, partial [Scytosiphon promiscuus]